MNATGTLAELLDSDEWRPAADVQGHMAEAGYTVDETRTARKWLGVTQAQGGVRFFNNRWHWRLAHNCPTCGRDWRDPWVRAADGDYWGREHPAPTVSTVEEDAIPFEDEPPVPIAPPSQPIRHESAGPATCNVCERTSAMGRGDPCPWFTGAGRCPGRMT